MSEPGDPLLGSTGATGETYDRWAYAVQVVGKVLLWLDLLWAIAWLVAALVMSFYTTPLPSTLVSGLPLYVYDRTFEYRNAHALLALHGFLPSVYFSLAAGYSHEPLVAWYMLPIGFAVAVDIYSNTQNWPKLSRDSIPAFFVLETVLATVALVLSLTVFLWYQAAYWHFHYTGKHFNDVRTPANRHRKEDDTPPNTGAASSSVIREQHRIKTAYPTTVSSHMSTQPRLRMAP
jgi:hypothetical protein